MFDYWRQSLSTKREIKKLESLMQRRALVEDATMLGPSIMECRGRIELQRGYLKRADTERWVAWAAKHGVELLPLEAHWETDEAIQKDVLTTKGKAFIRESISEKRAKFWRRWSPLISTIISILALVVSFIALFTK
jgi:hypothetical protein